MGWFVGFRNGVLMWVDGMFILYGVSYLLMFNICSFKCMLYLLFKCEVCGVDVFVIFQCDVYGMLGGKDYGFDMGVMLCIQVEVIQVLQFGWLWLCYLFCVGLLYVFGCFD